jgi:ferredoxin
MPLKEYSMTSKNIRSVVFYCSPAGTTAQAARVIERECSAQGDTGSLIDLSVNKNPEKDAQRAQGGDCLFIGSPVYACHALPQIMSCIQALPRGGGLPAVPFVTWGAVTSGVALAEMAQALEQKGYCVAGGAKILSVHSLMRDCEHPLGMGHPDARDEEKIRNMVRSITEKIRSGETGSVAPELDYQYPAAREEMQKLSLSVARSMLPPKHLDSGRCTQCGECERVCPARAITCAPLPEFSDRCIMCYSCVRACPENALQADLSGMERWLRTRSKDSPEDPATQIFF